MNKEEIQKAAEKYAEGMMGNAYRYYTEHADQYMFNLIKRSFIEGAEQINRTSLATIQRFNSLRAPLIEQVQRHDWRSILEVVESMFDGFPILSAPPQPLKRLEEITDEDMLGLASIVLDMPFQKYKTGWKVIRDFTVTGWPYIRVTHPKNVYSFELDCELVNFNVYYMEDTATAEHDMKPTQCIDYLRSKGYNIPNAYPMPVQVDNWVSVEDRKPEKESKYSSYYVWGLNEYGEVLICYYMFSINKWFSFSHDEIVITKWQPMFKPEPPTTKTK